MATEALKKDPLFGVGPNNFISSWMKHKPQSVNNTQFWNSDFNAGVGYVPTFFVTTGFVGGLLLSLFILSILYYGIKSLFYRKVESGDRSFLLLAFAGAVYLWIFAIIYVPDTVSLVLTFVVTGIFFSRLAESKIIPEIHYEMEANQNRQFVSAVSSASLILASTLLLYLVVVSAWALFDFQRSIYVLRTDQNIDLAKRLISRSIALNPQDIYYRGAIEINMLEMNNLLKQKMPANELVQSFSKIFSVAKANADSAVKINRSNYVNYIVRGELYKNMLALKIDGAYEKAAENYEMALEYNPLNPAIHLEFAKLEILRENKKMADDHLKQAIALKSDYLDAIFLQSQLYSEQGNLPAAIKQIEEASLLAPNDVGVLFQLGFLKYKAGDFRGARDVLERTVSISPIYANARYFLGLSYDRLGLKDLAIIEFEAIQNTNPGNAEIVGILDNLKSGKPALAESIKPERSNSLPVKGE